MRNLDVIKQRTKCY